MGEGFGKDKQEKTKLERKNTIKLIQKIFKTIFVNKGDAKAIYPLIKANQDKFDDSFIQTLGSWTKAQLTDKWSEESCQLAIELWNFSSLMGLLKTGNRANNLEIAIVGNEVVLTFFTRTLFPKEWADTYYNLGNAYVHRIRGEKAENLEQAIFCYKEALKENTRDRFFRKWADDLYNLANTYTVRIRGKKAENLEKAIKCYEEILTVLTIENYPETWVETLNNLGNTYSERIKGNRAESIELALHCFRETLKIRTYDGFPEQWAMSQYNLGLNYTKRIRGERAKNIEQAINFLNNALKVFTYERFPEELAQVHNVLGSAYTIRIQEEKNENIERAIHHCQEALKIRTKESLPKQWAETINNLGGAYEERIQGIKLDNIERSIQCYRESLQVYTKKDFPQEWSRSKVNLGNAFARRIKGDGHNNIGQSIQYYQEALQVYTQEDFPQEWARTNNGLGNAYSKSHPNKLLDSLAENKKAYGNILERAAKCYQNALTIYTQEHFPERWAMTTVNLGNVYIHQMQEQKAEKIECAIRCYQKALQVSTRENFPQKWAEIQIILGIAYGKRILGDKSENIEHEIYYLEQSLQQFTRLEFPEHWATIQNNLADAYENRVSGDKSENLKQAISYFTRALQAFNSGGFPKNTLSVGIKLGDLAFSKQMWDKAILGYGAAIDALETVRTWTISEFRRQEMQEAIVVIGIYQKIACSYIKTGQIDKALEYVERSRSKRLVDLMASNDLYGDTEVPQDVAEFLQQYENLQQQIDKLRSNNDSDGDRGLLNTSDRTRAALESNLATITDLEAQKQEVWQQIRLSDPVLAGEIQVNAPNITQMQQFIKCSTAAILSFFTTNTETYVFVLRQDGISLHTCDGQGVDTLQSWLSREWSTPYLKDNFQWQERLNFTLAQLAQKLQINKLIEEHLDGIEELIIVPHLLLHQIPFAAIPVRNGYLCDRFLIRYIPSCQVLEFCQQRPEIKTFIHGTVEDAEGNLPCASFEGEQIAQLFQIPREKRLQGSQEATCKNYRQLIEQVQSIHCCHHAESRLDNPLESRLKLADGSITLGQLMTPGWRLPDLSDVFLACCETGLGKPSLSDDLFTLSTGFLCAGARTVISSLWRVDDLATALFSIFYYQQIKQGKDPSYALQQAQIQLRQLKKEDLRAIAIPIQNRKKELIKERNKYLSGSIERLQWEHQYKTYAEMTRKVNDILNAPEELPFSEPFNWAAFVCQGLR